MTGNNNPGAKDTLAAAHAAAGEYDQAAALAQRALKLARAANADKLADEIAKHLALYRQNKPYRE